jgi:cytochrome oxidase Cu insertion factor (SCO1/SenC/PrrC family)
MRDPIRHLKALSFAVTVFLITTFALAQFYPQVFPFMPYVWPYISGGTLSYSGTELESAPAPHFTLRNQRGETVSLADHQGKVILLTFLDPLCTDDCPLMAQEIAAAYEGLGADATDVAVLAINVNPETQTPQAMEAFLKAYGLDGGPAWQFLGGEAMEVAEIVAAYHVSAGEPKPSKPGEVVHQDVVFLIDRQGNLRVLITYPTPVGAALRDVITQRVRQLL